MSEIIRNIAVSGVDTQKKYDNVCTICGDISAYHNYINDYSIVYDHTEKSGFMHNWEPQEYSHCTLYTYEEFIEKFGEKEMSEKLCVSGYGENVYFKKPTFDYAQMCIGSDNLIHGQVLNTKQDKWKLKKWNKETGKVVGSGRNTATYFDLIPVSYIEAIEEHTKEISREILSEIKKITENELSVIKEAVACDGKWNGYYIEASQEAYDLLVAYGYENGKTTSTLRNGILQKGLFLISNNKITWCQKNSFAALSIFKNGKALYTVDGELSATQYSPNEGALKKEQNFAEMYAQAGIEKLKKKYATGKYDCYYKMSDDAPMWERLINPHLDDKFSEYKLILKEHSHIADAVIANPFIGVLSKNPSTIEKFNNYFYHDFFSSYNEELHYCLKEQPKQESKYTKASDVFLDCDIEDLPNAFTVTEDKSFVVGSQYKHLKCDTVEWSKQNHTIEQQKAICQFMINKYSMRKKEQDTDDIVKIKFYVEWLEQIVKS